MSTPEDSTTENVPPSKRAVGGRTPRTQAMWEAMVSGFARAWKHHGRINYAAAAALADVDERTAKRAWLSGWGPKYGGGKSIQQIMGNHELAARALRAAGDRFVGAAKAEADLVMQVLRAGAAEADLKDSCDTLERAAASITEMEAKANLALKQAELKLAEIEALGVQKHQEIAESRSQAETAAKATLHKAEMEARAKLGEILSRAKVDAAETMADEAAGAKFGRKAALGAVAIAALVLKDAQVIAQQIRQAIGDISKLTPAQAINLALSMTRLVESAEKALILSMQAERIRVGEPTEVIGIASLDGNLADREVKLRAVARALEKQKLKLVQGGAEGAVPGGA